MTVCRFTGKCWPIVSPYWGSLMSLQQLKKGVVTLTVRTRLRSPSLTPCVTPTLLSRSSSPSSSASGGIPVPGPDEADGSSSSRKGPGPKDRIVMDVTLNKGEGPWKLPCRTNPYFVREFWLEIPVSRAPICVCLLLNHRGGEKNIL